MMGNELGDELPVLSFPRCSLETDARSWWCSSSEDIRLIRPAGMLGVMCAIFIFLMGGYSSSASDVVGLYMFDELLQTLVLFGNALSF